MRITGKAHGSQGPISWHHQKSGSGEMFSWMNQSNSAQKPRLGPYTGIKPVAEEMEIDRPQRMKRKRRV